MLLSNGSSRIHSCRQINFAWPSITNVLMSVIPFDMKIYFWNEWVDKDARVTLLLRIKHRSYLQIDNGDSNKDGNG